MKILIVKTSSLGDIIHALPVLDFLHQTTSQTEVDWVVEEPFRDVLTANPLISQLHLVRTKQWRKQPLNPRTHKEVRAVKEALQARKYDYVFDIQGNFKSGMIAWLSGGRHRIGFTKDVLQESVNTWFTTRQVPIRRHDVHVTDQCLRLVSVPFGKDFREMRLNTDIATSPEDDATAEMLLATLSDGLVFLFHHGTTWQTKLWTREGWVALGKRVLESFPDATILLSSGNDAERTEATAIAGAIGKGARLIDRYPLKGLAALLKKVDLVVGPDTGPVHLAAAVNTPTVSFYRASDGARSGPRGEHHVTIQAPVSCGACFRTRCDRDAKCRESITVDAMWDGICKILRQ